MTTRLAVSQSPQSLQIPGMDVMAGRETSCGLEKRPLNVSEAQGFLLPPNMREAFPDADLDWVGYQVKCNLLLNTFSVFLPSSRTVCLFVSSLFFYHFLCVLQMIITKFNPYQWHKSHQKLKTEIMSLEFTDSKGAILPVGGNNIDIDIKIPLNSGNSSLNNFFVRPRMMRYHTVELNDISDSMIIEVKPINRSLTMLVYVKYGDRPTVNSYHYTAIVPDFSSCGWVNVSDRLVVKCSRRPYEIMSTVDFNQTGLYYVGVLYVEQVSGIRVRRSCFGRRRKKRDCVEPKPPPLKGIEYNRTLTFNPSTDQNYSVKVLQYSCYYFSLTQDEWTKDGCKVGSKYLNIL